MHAYRSPTPSVPPGISDRGPSARSAATGLFGPALLACGSVIGFAGIIFADGAECSIGAVMVMAALFWRLTHA
jgi:hypothetical protein